MLVEPLVCCKSESGKITYSERLIPLLICEWSILVKEIYVMNSTELPGGECYRVGVKMNGN